MEEKQQTAVEWIIDNLMINGLIRLTKDQHNLFKELTDLSKEMEQDQLDKAYRDGLEYANKYPARLP